MIAVSAVTIEIRGAGSWRGATRVAGSGVVGMHSENLRKMKVCSTCVARPWWAKWERAGKRRGTAGSSRGKRARPGAHKRAQGSEPCEVPGGPEPRSISRTESSEHPSLLPGDKRRLPALAETSWLLSIKALLHVLITYTLPGSSLASLPPLHPISFPFFFSHILPEVSRAPF